MLTTLTPAEASDLAQIAGAAVTHLQHVADGCLAAIRANPDRPYGIEAAAERAEALRLQAVARKLETAALARSRQAEREQAVGVRMIEALAHVLGGRVSVRRAA